MESIKKLIIPNIILVLILLFTFFTRTYNLSILPYGFFCDEASIGYNAYSILTTGKDEYGVSFPVFFRSLDDFRPPLAIYSAVPFIYLFGLSETTTRLPSVFYGIAIVIAVYYIGKYTYSKEVGLFASFAAATMPWLIHYNRRKACCGFFIVSVLFFILSNHYKKFLIPAFISTALALYTYQSAKLLALLLLVGALFIYRKSFMRHRKELLAGIIMFLIIGIPFVLSFLNGEATARFNMVSVFSSHLSTMQIIIRVITNYPTQLSPSFFLSGEQTLITRHFTHGLAPLLLITLPFLYIGLLKVCLEMKKKTSQLLLFLFVIYPIAGAVTLDPPFSSRSIIGAPVMAIFIGIGATSSLNLIKHSIFKGFTRRALVFLFLVNAYAFLLFYFSTYPTFSSDFWGWQYGPRDIMSYFLKNKSSYDQLVIMGNFNAPYIFIKFYDPTNTCKNKCVLGDITNYDPHKKQLFAIETTRTGELHGLSLKNKKTLYYPGHVPAFYIGTLDRK